MPLYILPCEVEGDLTTMSKKALDGNGCKEEDDQTFDTE